MDTAEAVEMHLDDVLFGDMLSSKFMFEDEEPCQEVKKRRKDTSKNSRKRRMSSDVIIASQCIESPDVELDTTEDIPLPTARRSKRLRRKSIEFGRSQFIHLLPGIEMEGACETGDSRLESEAPQSEIESAHTTNSDSVESFSRQNEGVVDVENNMTSQLAWEESNEIDESIKSLYLNKNFQWPGLKTWTTIFELPRPSKFGSEETFGKRRTARRIDFENMTVGKLKKRLKKASQNGWKRRRVTPSMDDAMQERINLLDRILESPCSADGSEKTDSTLDDNSENHTVTSTVVQVNTDDDFVTELSKTDSCNYGNSVNKRTRNVKNGKRKIHNRGRKKSILKVESRVPQSEMDNDAWTVGDCNANIVDSAIRLAHDTDACDSKSADNVSNKDGVDLMLPLPGVEKFDENYENIGKIDHCSKNHDSSCTDAKGDMSVPLESKSNDGSECRKIVCSGSVSPENDSSIRLFEETDFSVKRASDGKTDILEYSNSAPITSNESMENVVKINLMNSSELSRTNNSNESVESNNNGSRVDDFTNLKSARRISRGVHDLSFDGTHNIDGSNNNPDFSLDKSLSKIKPVFSPFTDDYSLKKDGSLAASYLNKFALFSAVLSKD